MERRNFIKAAGALCGVAVIPASVLESCSKSSTGNTNVNFNLDITSGSYTVLQTVGGSVVANNVLIMKVDSTTYSAVAVSCTHEGCSVGYQSSSKKVVCPCHGGTFDTNGKVLSGPPQTNLQKYTVTQSGNILTIKS